MPPLIQRLSTIGPMVAAAIAAPLARLTFGQAFLFAGLGKLKNLDGTTSYFTSLGLPMPGAHAVAIGGIELVGGALLLLGLFTRSAALVLGGTMVGAICLAERSAFLGALSAINPDKGLTDLVPWMFGLGVLWLVAWGPGFLSLDQVWRHWRQRHAAHG